MSERSRGIEAARKAAKKVVAQRVPGLDALRADRDAHAATSRQLEAELAVTRAELTELRRNLSWGPEAVAEPVAQRVEAARTAGAAQTAGPAQAADAAMAVDPALDLAAGVPGVDMDLARQLEVAAALYPFSVDAPWDEPGARYRATAVGFSPADATVLAAMLRQRRPSTAVLLGHGWALAATLDIRDRWLPDLEVVCVVQDTAGITLTESDRTSVRWIVSPLASALGEVAGLLTPGSALVVEGGDGSGLPLVVAELLPRLGPGVLVQLPLTLAGSIAAVTDATSERAAQADAAGLVWSYLAGNRGVRVLLATNWLRAHHYGEFAKRLTAVADGAGDSLYLESLVRLAPARPGPAGAPEPAGTVEPAGAEQAGAGAGLAHPDVHETAAAVAPVEQRPTPVRLIEWDGERCVPWTDDLQVVYEHYHRYLLAAGVLAAAGPPRTVLDLASGEGYGSDLLAAHGHRVTGIELAPAAVRHAAAKYARPGLAFRQGSMLDLSAFADGSVGAVTCYEALEHVTEHDQLLGEIDRVLAPDGLLFISSPDRTVYTDVHHNHNPFHVRELDRDELTELLHQWFPAVAMWGQNVAVGSVMVPYAGIDGTGAPVVHTLAADGPERDRWAELEAPAATYLIAVAGRAALPPLPPVTLLRDRDLTLVLKTIGERDQARAQLAAHAIS